MLSIFAKLMLVTTSLAPVLFTYAFVHYTHHGPAVTQVSVIAIALGLVLLCGLVLKAVTQQFEAVDFPIDSVKTADTEIIGYVVVYLLPLVTAVPEGVNTRLLVFLVGLIVFVVWTSNAYHFNPLMSLFGLHFYEVTTKGGITFLLITRRDVRSTAAINRVFQLTNYMVLDTGDKS